MMKPISASLIVMASLSACATPTPPTVTASDVDDAFDEATRISALPQTAIADLPTGSVTYNGQIGANVSGDAQGSILADMTMIVGFSSNDIDGNVSNINLINPDGTPDQLLTGTLQMSGIESNGDLDATASGTVQGVDNSGFVVNSDMNIVLDGAVYDDTGQGDAVYGSAEGAANGDFLLDIDGVFFGTSN
ncbi:hypothetical protein [Yoonia sp. BS5-3]|uniref:Transferrin-binding protein B C-lobe/N-lobe beta barrel domain-containing protein n=1 Tax=Yoonia phaeophyticola TaxID=3137369 RepID=A0ABZ2VBJ8_9RHOB